MPTPWAVFFNSAAIPLISNALPLPLAGAFITALIASLLGTYAVRRWSLHRGYVDRPDTDRRIHTLPTPNVGGTAVMLATTLTFVGWSFVIVPGQVARPEIIAMLLGGLVIFAVGFWDDTRRLSVGVKFALQFAVAAAVFFGGVRILGVGFGELWRSQFSVLASFVVTSLWIVGTTNAFNLIDGSDGVGAGAALFAAASLAVAFGLNADPIGALMATVLAGACLGFLFFNFPPASIFLGDCGSLFVGFTLATLAVVTTQKSATVVAMAIPIVAFGVPLLDTAIAIVRRFLRRDPIFGADRGHIHHRLRGLGHSPRGVAMLLYLAFAGCASLSVALAAPGRSTVVPVFLVAGAVLVVGVQRLKIPELMELSRVLGRGLQQRAVITHNLRIYEAVDTLSTVGSGAELAAALDRTFHGTEFSRIELHVRPELGAGLEGVHGVLRDASGHYSLSLTFEHLLNPEHRVEIRVPIIDSDRHAGTLSFFRTTEGDRLYTDVRLVSKMLMPALVETLRRAAEAHASAERRMEG